MDKIHSLAVSSVVGAAAIDGIIVAIRIVVDVDLVRRFVASDEVASDWMASRRMT